MNLPQRLLSILLLTVLTVAALAQNYDTPTFNFDRKTDAHYVDSLVQTTRARLTSLDRLYPDPRVDTARMEYMHFIAYALYSGVVKRDSALLIANQLIRMAERRQNVKYQIKGLLMAERYYRGSRTNYPRAIQLNYKILSLIETSPIDFDEYLWRVQRNLGNISAAIGEQLEAVAYFQKSIDGFSKDQKSERVHLADLHQQLAAAYLKLRKLDEAETHYLISWDIVSQQHASTSNRAYLTNDIGKLYNVRGQFTRAIPYLKQSAAYWASLNSPLPQADALADLAEAYAGLGQYDDAIAAANDALVKNQKVYATVLTAYAVLIRAYEHQHDWKNAFAYQRLYHLKKLEEERTINQTESLRSKARFDLERLKTAHRQEQLLQQQRYQTLAKQAEIDRLNSAAKTSELLRLSQTNALKHQLETQQLKAVAGQKQARQQATIKQLKIDQLRLNILAQTRLRNQLYLGIGIISLLGLLLLYYSLRLRRTNVALRTKNREIERALVRGQTLERKRVASELHDRVSSLLGATKMTFQTIDSATLLPRDRQLYENSLDLLNDAVTQVRQLAHNLIPEQLLQQTLCQSIRNLARKLNGVGKTAFTFIGDPAEPFPLRYETKFNLYVICLELCTNILRHAQAQQARIELLRADDWLVLLITDDGVGFANLPEAGMGLHNIRERAEAIGAQFRIEPGEVTGTKASVLLHLGLQAPA